MQPEYRLKLYRGLWHIVWRAAGTTKRTSLHTKDRDAASRAFADAVKSVQIPGDTVGEIVKAYMADKNGIARSYAAMESAWRAAQPTFGHLRPDQINRFLCRSYAVMRRKSGTRGKPLSDGTIIKELSFVKAAVRWQNNATHAVFEMPHAPPPRDRYLTRDEFERLLQACEAAHIELFIHLALATAGRASALFELTWDRVDFERGQVRLSAWEGRRKGRATVPMTDRLRKALEDAYSVRTCERVIEWGGAPVKSVKRSFAGACRRAGIVGVTPHVLRHTSAVWMIEDGLSVAEIAQFLGHNDVKTTFKIYARFSPSFLKNAARALDRRA